MMTDFERASIQIEKQKLTLENRKLQFEKDKPKPSSFWPISAPIIVAFLTIGFGLHTNSEQSRQEFLLAVVNAVSDQDRAYGTLKKLQFFSEAFPEQIPMISDCTESQGRSRCININKYGSFSTDDVAKKVFIEQIRQAGASPKDLLELWRVLLTSEEWADDTKLTSLISAIKDAKQDTAGRK